MANKTLQNKNRHAYMIICHNNFEQLCLLLNLLDDERNDIYIHVDKKVKEPPFQMLKEAVKHSGLYFTKRVEVTWGGYSQILSELSLLEAVAEGLVVSYVDECCTESLVDLCKLSSHGCTELSVQVGERLVEKEYLRITNDSTTQRNTLLLTTGKSLRLSFEKVRNVENTCSLFYAALDLLLGSLAELKTECHVIKYGHVRIKSVVLENHRDITVLRCYVVYESVADEELTFGDLLKTCDHTKSCGLTASGRANEDKELFVLDIEAEVGYSGNAAGIFLVDMLQGKTCHCVIPP